MITETDVVKEVIGSICESTAACEVILEEHHMFDDLGIDSLQMIRLILELEERLQRKIFDVDNIAEIRTVGDIIKLL